MASKRLTVALSQLLPGDRLAGPGGTQAAWDAIPAVSGVQVIGPLVIVDFVDSTATAPMSNSLVEVLRETA